MSRIRTPEPGMLPTALIYTRVSSEEQAREGVSLDAQLAECRRYAVAHGWVFGPEFQDVLSGKRDDRPQYQALLAESRRLRAEGQPVMVVVLRLDRLGRNILERVRAREELKVLGVPVHSVREGGEVSDLVANILASVAEEETRALGERVAASLQHIAANGWYPPGRAPWGYRLRPATAEERTQSAPLSVLERDPDTSPWVEEAFARAANGATLHAVHRWATALPSSARGGRVLTFQAFRRIMASPVYIGRQPTGDPDPIARPRGRWEPLVDDATWLRVREHVNSHHRIPRQASQRYLLSGIIRCPLCGARMHGRARPHRARSYRCSSGTLGANAHVRQCPGNALSEQVDEATLYAVQQLVDAAVSTVSELRSALEVAWAALREPIELKDKQVVRQLAQLKRNAEQARTRLTKAAILYADGNLDKTGYDLLRDAARADLDAANAEIARLEETVAPLMTLPSFEEVLVEAGGWAGALRSSDTAAQRAVLTELIERVEPVRVGRGSYQVTIAWTALGQALGSAIDLSQSMASWAAEHVDETRLRSMANPADGESSYPSQFVSAGQSMLAS